jgi:hypothetical protein
MLNSQKPQTMSDSHTTSDKLIIYKDKAGYKYSLRGGNEISTKKRLNSYWLTINMVLFQNKRVNDN